MHPILFEIGGFPIHTYGALGAAAFLVGAGLCLLRARQQGFDLNRFSDLIFWMAVLSLVGARLTWLLQNPSSVRSAADLVNLRNGGLVFYGSFLTGFPVGFALMRRYDLPAFLCWDIFGTAFPISHAISRLGCFAAGCCYGSPTESAWGVTFPADSALAPAGIPLHPVQLYEAAGLLLIGVVTNVLFRRRSYDGQIFLLYMLMYAALRAGTEIFRGDPDRGLFLPQVFGDVVSFSQGVSAVFAGVGLTLFLWDARRRAVATP